MELGEESLRDLHHMTIHFMVMVCIVFKRIADIIPEVLSAQPPSNDTLAERLRRRPAKPMVSPRVGSNPTGVDAIQLRQLL